MNEEIFIPISLFAAIVFIVYLFLSTRNKERMALIEKGVDAGLFQTKKTAFPVLKIGMFLAGIGLGILFGNIVAVTTPLKTETAYFSMIFLFAGMSLIINYLIEKNKEESN